MYSKTVATISSSEPTKFLGCVKHDKIYISRYNREQTIHNTTLSQTLGIKNAERTRDQTDVFSKS